MGWNGHVLLGWNAYAVLLEVYEAAEELNRYEDFGEPSESTNCEWLEPEHFQATRRRLYDALVIAREMLQPRESSAAGGE